MTLSTLLNVVFYGIVGRYPGMVAALCFMVSVDLRHFCLADDVTERSKVLSCFGCWHLSLLFGSLDLVEERRRLWWRWTSCSFAEIVRIFSQISTGSLGKKELIELRRTLWLLGSEAKSMGVFVLQKFGDSNQYLCYSLSFSRRQLFDLGIGCCALRFWIFSWFALFNTRFSSYDCH